MTTTEMPLIETIQKCTPKAKAAILAILLREQIEAHDDGKPLSLEDENDKHLGTFVPAIRPRADHAKSPPLLTPEVRAELQRRYENRDKALSVEKMLSSLDLDDPAPSSKS